MSAARFSELQVIDTLIIQGVAVTCFRCGDPFTREDVKAKNVQREHLHETKLGGPNEPGNCRYSHRDAPCHHTVTFGTPATTAGSSLHRIAKTQGTRAEKFKPIKIPLDQERPEKTRFGNGFKRRAT